VRWAGHVTIIAVSAGKLALDARRRYARSVGRFGEGDLVDASSAGGIGESPSEDSVPTRTHFGRALGDDWLEVEPGIYLPRGEASDLPTADAPEESLDEALAGALRPDDEGGTERAEGGRLRRWLHR